MAEVIAAGDMRESGLPTVEVSWHAGATEEGGGAVGGLPPQRLVATEWVPLPAFASASVVRDSAAAAAGGGASPSAIASPLAGAAPPEYTEATEDAVQAWVLGLGSDGLPYHSPTAPGGGGGGGGGGAAAASGSVGGWEMVAFASQQLLLAAALCEGRNYTCLAALQPRYPLKLLLGALTQVAAGGSDGDGDGGGGLRDALCAACATLVHRLWLDRAPQEPLRLPQLVRVWTALTAPPALPTRVPALHLVLELALNLLSQQHDDDDQQQSHSRGGGRSPRPHAPLLTSALLALVADLVTFGYAAAAADVPAVLRPIGATLAAAAHFDGGPAPASSLAPRRSSAAATVGSPGRRGAADGADEGDAADAPPLLSRAVDAARRVVTPRGVTPRAYVRMIDEDDAAALEGSAGAGGGESGSGSDDDDDDDDVTHIGAAATRAADDVRIGASARPWLQVQLAALSVLLALRDRHAEALLTRFLGAWRASIVHEGAGGAPGQGRRARARRRQAARPPPRSRALDAFTASLRAEEVSPLDAVAVSGGRALAFALRRLLASPHKPLASRALHLLLTLKCPRHALLATAGRVQLLHGEAAERRRQQQWRALASLSSLVEQYEVWGALKTAPDARRMGKCAQLLRALAEQCIPPPGADDAEGGGGGAELGSGGGGGGGGGASAVFADELPAGGEADDAFDDLHGGHAGDASAAALPPAWLRVDSDAQGALRHWGAHEPLGQLLRLPLDADADARTLSTFRRERRSLHGATHAFAAALCCGSPANGRALFRQMPLLLAHAAALPESAVPMLLHLFRGDRHLCASAPRALFTLLVRMHQADGGLTARADGFHEVIDSAFAADPAAASRPAAATARQRTLLALLRPRGFPLRRSAEMVAAELMAALQPPPAAPAAPAAIAGAADTATTAVQLPGSSPTGAGYLRRQADVAAALGVPSAAVGGGGSGGGGGNGGSGGGREAAAPTPPPRAPRAGGGTCTPSSCSPRARTAARRPPSARAASCTPSPTPSTAPLTWPTPSPPRGPDGSATPHLPRQRGRRRRRRRRGRRRRRRRRVAPSPHAPCPRGGRRGE